jgi:uncharacterized membrane protein
MKKDNPGKDLALLILGMILTVAGLFLLFNQLEVSSSFFGGNVNFFGMLGSGVPTGTIIIPLIIGVVLMVIFPKQIWPKVVSGLAVLIIILAVISSVRITYIRTNFFTFLLMILLIFVGAALVLRILLGTDKSDKTEK